MAVTRAPSLPGYRTAEQAAKQFDYEYSYFTRLCREERVPGAVKVAGVWWIPKKTTAAQIRVKLGPPFRQGTKAKPKK